MTEPAHTDDHDNGRYHRWVVSGPTERVMLDGIRACVLVSVVIAMVVLGINGVIDAAAVTGVLGGVVGAIGSQAGTAVASRIMHRSDQPGAS